MLKTCTTALEVLLCLPPLHIYVKRESAQCAFRLLRRTTDLRPGAVASHLGILRNFPEMTMPISMTDFRPDLPHGQHGHVPRAENLGAANFQIISWKKCSKNNNFFWFSCFINQ